MRHIAGTLLAVALVASSAVAQPPASPPVAAPDPTAAMTADPLNTSATYAFIMDGDGGLPLYSKRGDEPMIPASMSKLMLYYMTFERLKAGRLTMTDEFTVSEHAWRTGGAGTDGSTMFLPLNSKASVQDLLKGAIIVSGNVNFHPSAGNGVNADTQGRIDLNSNYSISRGSGNHWIGGYGGTVACIGRTITITGTPAFGTAFANATTVGLVVAVSNTFSGSATGKRYSAVANGVVQTFGASSTAFPGDVAGTTATGGLYV